MSYVYIPLKKAKNVQKIRASSGTLLNIFKSKSNFNRYYLLPCDYRNYSEGVVVDSTASKRKVIAEVLVGSWLI